MILPAVNQNERPPAQICPQVRRPLSRTVRPAMVTLSATVPSCFYPADAYKTCYPSPIRRSAGFPARPPFFAEKCTAESLTSPQAVKGVGVASGTSTGDARKCALNLQSQHYSRPHWPSQDVTHQTLNAPARAPLLGASARRFLAALSPQVLLWALPQARSATTLTSAKTYRAGLTRTTLNSNHRGLRGVGGFFVRSSKARHEGMTTCSRNS